MPPIALYSAEQSYFFWENFKKCFEPHFFCVPPISITKRRFWPKGFSLLYFILFLEPSDLRVVQHFLWWNPSVSGGKAHSYQRNNSGNPFFICVRKSRYLYDQKELVNDIQNVACLIPNLLFFKETLKFLFFFLCQITRCDPCPWPGHTKQHPICQTISRILDAEVFSLGKLKKCFKFKLFFDVKIWSYTHLRGFDRRDFLYFTS